MGACGNCIHKETAGSDYPCNICDNVTHYEEPKPMTNADQIRAMSDEELKKFIVSISNPIAFSYVTGEDIVMKWLQQEVE